MKCRTKFKFGLTIIMFAAVYVCYTIQSLMKNQSELKENLSDGKDVHEEGKREYVKQKYEEKGNLLLKNQKIWMESIHLSVVVCGNRGNETIVMLKSALIFTKSFIILHIFAEERLRVHLKKQLNAWLDHFWRKFEYHIYDISYPEQENFLEWKKLFKPCASQRLFLPALLPSVDSLLYVDTDVIFLSPVQEIWSHFKRFNSSQLAALAPENEVKEKSWYRRFARHPYYGVLGVNSGVILMNLTKMRNSKWTESMIDFYKAYKHRIKYGDQDLINIYFHFHPDQLYVYNCEWNFRPDHCMYASVCKGADHYGAYVLHGCRRTMHNDKNPSFKAVYDGFSQYDMQIDTKERLLERLKRNLDLTKSTSCGRVSHIFTKKIEHYIENSLF